jgi:beta-mannosidase
MVCSAYTEHKAHFVSEIGYHGCPNLSSIKRFIDEQHQWPWQDNPQWILHSTDMTGNPYRINLMANQVKELFGTVPDNIEDFILGSQVSQAEAKKFFVEMTRIVFQHWLPTVLWRKVADGTPARPPRCAQSEPAFGACAAFCFRDRR